MELTNMPKKVLFDSMVYDDLVKDSFRNLYDRARAQQLIELITPHITFDQLGKIPDSNKRNSVLSIAGTHNTVYTFGHIEGISRPNWSVPAPQGTLEKILGNQDHNERNKSDALLASTAKQENAILVTCDIPLRNRCKRENINTMNTEEFKKFLTNLLIANNPST